MNPLDLLAWAGAIGGVVIITALAVVFVVAAAKALARPKRKRTRQVMNGGDESAF